MIIILSVSFPLPGGPLSNKFITPYSRNLFTFKFTSVLVLLAPPDNKQRFKDVHLRFFLKSLDGLSEITFIYARSCGGLDSAGKPSLTRRS